MVKFRQLLITISIAATLVASGALAQTNLTQILDTITNPDGTSFNGTVVITWNGYSGSGSGTVSRLSTSARVYNGALSVLLVPTTTASPGTYYQVVYTSSDGTTSWTETWQVPPSTTALTVAAVRQTTTEGSGTGTGTGSTGTTTGSQYATLPIAMSNVTGLSSSLSAINTTVASQGTSLTTLTSNLSSLTTTVAANTSSLNTVNSTVGGLSTNVTNLTNLVNGLNTTVSTLSAAGASSVVFVDSETPAGTMNGTNLAFSLANTPAPATSLMLFRNGLALTAGVDFTLSGSAITFTSATPPQTGDILLAYYRMIGTGSTTNFTDNETPGGSINGTNRAFTLAATPNPSTSLQLFRNGVLLDPGTDYTLSGSAITIISAVPQPGDSLQVYYRH